MSVVSQATTVPSESNTNGLHIPQAPISQPPPPSTQVVGLSSGTPVISNFLPVGGPATNAPSPGIHPLGVSVPQSTEQLTAVPMDIPKVIPQAPVVGTDPATIRGGPTGPGSGGQLLQFPWKLHEMLHLAEKNGKTDVISWLPGGNGFKVHNKERFCQEIMPGYFASQKYKTFQRSLNLWGFESVARGVDRGACYHQYFVKGRPELCHSMTRVKIKGQSNPRTPAAAHAAAAAKRVALSAFAQPPGVPAATTATFPLQQNAVGHHPPMHAAPQLGIQLNGTIVPNPYSMVAINNFAALQQLNPALAALQNPAAINALLAAQMMATAASSNPVPLQAFQLQPAQQYAAVTTAPIGTPTPQDPPKPQAPAPVVIPVATNGPVPLSQPPMANANANYAEFLARKSAMERQSQPTVAQSSPPTNNNNSEVTIAPPLVKPSPNILPREAPAPTVATASVKTEEECVAV